MRTLAFAVPVALLCALTLVALVLGDGDLVVAIAPALVCGTLYAIWRAPLRHPALVLMFLALTLESPSDVPAAGRWRSPLYPAGALLLAHLNVTFPAHHWLLFSGLDLILAYLLAVAFVRWLHRSRVDQPGGAADPLPGFVALSLGAAAWMWCWGIARGGADVASSLWQVERVAYLPLVFVVFRRALRSSADRAAAGKVVVAAACVKAALALYVRATVAPPPGESVLPYATTHTDSMLFASAFCLVAAHLLEGLDRRRVLAGIAVLPLLVAGMIANNRRVVWVEVAAGLATLAALSPWTRVKRAIARAAIVSAPIVLAYAVAGWGSTAKIFAPVAVARSVVDSKADPSTEWRDWENYDLFFTLRQGPLFGSGYGHGYVELVKLPDISQAYALYRFIPHNSILGLLAYGGLFGFAALFAMLVVAMFLAARACRFARRRVDRTAALASASAIVVYLVHCYGDMGLGTWTSVFTIAPAFAVIGRVAVATGAWPPTARRRAPGLEIAISPSTRPPIPALPAGAARSS